MISDPEDLVDHLGGVRVPRMVKTKHECRLPAASGSCRDLLAYRAACGHWWRPKRLIEDWDDHWEWRKVGPLRRWWWRSRGLRLPG